MSAKEHKKDQRGEARLALVSDLVIGADGTELSALIAEQGGQAGDYLAKSKNAISKALLKFRADSQAPTQVQGALGTLLVLLRRKQHLTEEGLAQRANVDSEEIKRIEFDQNFVPHPRTIYQLERHFSLPEKTMLKLSGAVKYDDPEFEREVTLFAARAKRLESLTQDELSLLNEFVRFLSKHSH